MARIRVLVPLVLLVAACGDDDGPRTTADVCPDRVAASDDLLDRLLAAPCVASATEIETGSTTYRGFDLHVTQLVDHQDPTSGTFEQQVTLLVRYSAAPTILVSTGYDNYYGLGLSEPAQLVAGNQLVVEHRYFGSSIPADPDWTQLTIANAADDHHQIVRTLQPLLTGPWISTGVSKGGMTSVYHRRFWPDDVAGTIAYVAPLSFGAPDYGYDPFVDQVGTPECRKALEDIEVELLRRRAMLEEHAAAQIYDDLAYTRIALPAAVEGAVTSVYWAFWQYEGADRCWSVPSIAAADEDLWSFLLQVSPVWGLSDSWLEKFQAYDYQAAYELGSPGTHDNWLDGLTLYGDDDYAGSLPPGVAIPSLRDDAMEDIDDWVQDDGDRLLFLYGEWDPWSGGKFRLGDARESALLVEPEGTHDASIGGLEAADHEAALQMLAAWTGVTPIRRPRGSPPPEHPSVECRRRCSAHSAVATLAERW